MSKQPRHIMSFTDNESLKLDRVCRMLRSADVNYIVTPDDSDPGFAQGKTLWVISKINNALHMELKARAIGVVFAIDAQDQMVSFPKVQPLNFTGQFVTLPSEEVR